MYFILNRLCKASRNIGHGRPQGGKNEHSPPGNWFNSCHDSLFTGMTLTLHTNQLHCSGVMQWWELVPLLSRQKEVAKYSCGSYYCWSLLRNNGMAADLQRFTSSYGSRRFAACDCWTQINILAGNAMTTRQWLLIGERLVVLYCVKRSISQLVAKVPQVWKVHC